MGAEKRLFAIGDLHLSLYNEKPMSIFGENWINHHKKIEENWKSTVTDNDTVLIPGDISWAMTLEEAMPDLEFINSFPGKKILLKGNHDYWWGSISRLNSMFENMDFLQNDFFVWENFAVCGSRGWLAPSAPNFKPEDERPYKRELKRYRLSLEAAKRKKMDNIIFMSHYPPVYCGGAKTEFSVILEEFGVKKAVYGHLHGKENFDYGQQGEVNNIEYSLVSSDYLDFTPKRII